jgi:hypothetical protein
VDSAHETIEGIRLIKRELPGVFTILGVSNVSFGLDPAARYVLNSVFLHHCVSAGSTRRSSTRRTSRRTPRSAPSTARWRTISCSTAARRAAAFIEGLSRRRRQAGR